MPSVFGSIVAIIIVGSIAGIIHNRIYSRGVFHPAPAKKSVKKPAPGKAAPPATAPDPVKPVEPVVKKEAPVQVPEPTEPKIVTVEEAGRIYDEGKMIWVDARSRSNFEWGRVPGAINLPQAEFDELMPSLAGRIPKDRVIVVYCSSVNCDDAALLLGKMMKSGYHPRNLIHFEAGWDAWELFGFPVEKDPGK